MWARGSSKEPRRRIRPRWDALGALSCPSCGESARDAFEERGNDEETGAPIVRCNACLSGMTVKARRGLPRRNPQLIDPETWGRLELAWSSQPTRATSTAPDPIEDPEKLIVALRDQGLHGETLTHLLAETLNKSPAEAALLIAAVSGGSAA